MVLERVDAETDDGEDQEEDDDDKCNGDIFFDHCVGVALFLLFVLLIKDRAVTSFLFLFC